MAVHVRGTDTVFTKPSRGSMQRPILRYAVPKTSEYTLSILSGLFEKGKEILKIFTLLWK